eukprot:PhM_4_TR18660/c3_g1_i2/m.19873
MANVALTADQMRATLDVAGVAVNVSVEVTWADLHSPVRTDSGVILSITGTRAAGDLTCLVSYAFGTYPLPPADDSVRVYALKPALGARGGMGMAAARAEQRGVCQISPTDPRSWAGFIENCREEPLKAAQLAQSFTVWLRSRHGIPSADRNATFVPGGRWENSFEFHRHNGLLRILTGWVEACQINENWYAEKNLQLAEEIVAEAEMFLVPKNRRGALARELGSADLQGRVGRAVNKAQAAKKVRRGRRVTRAARHECASALFYDHQSKSKPIKRTKSSSSSSSSTQDELRSSTSPTSTSTSDTRTIVPNSTSRSIHEFDCESFSCEYRIRGARARERTHLGTKNNNNRELVIATERENGRGTSGEHMGKPVEPVQTIRRVCTRTRSTRRGECRNDDTVAAISRSEVGVWHQEIYSEGVLQGSRTDSTETGTRTEPRSFDRVPTSSRPSGCTCPTRPSSSSYPSQHRSSDGKAYSRRSDGTHARMEDLFQDRGNSVSTEGTCRTCRHRQMDHHVPISQGGPVSLGHGHRDEIGTLQRHVHNACAELKRGPTDIVADNGSCICGAAEHFTKPVSPLGEERGSDNPTTEPDSALDYSAHGKAPRSRNSANLSPKTRSCSLSRHRGCDARLMRLHTGLELPIRGARSGGNPEPVLVEGSDGVHLVTPGNRFFRPPSCRVHRNAGQLAYIPTSTLDLKKLQSWDPQYLSILDVISDVEVFTSLLTGLPVKKKTSRFMLQHTSSLQDCGLLRQDSELYAILQLFTVPKKDESLRLITDGRPLNANFAPPPSMDLPRIHELISDILSHEYVAQADARGYFFQFPLSRGVSKYFGARLGAGRGATKDFAMTRMAMGFSWAPAIAQRTSNVLVRGLGVCWVDNFAIYGNDLQDFARRRNTFLQRAVDVNLLLDDTTLQPTTRTIMVGVEMCLETKRYRMDPKWALSTVLRWAQLRLAWTPRVMYEIMGLVVWHGHVTRSPLCTLPLTFQWLGSTASLLARGQLTWDETIGVPDGVIAAFARISHNTWCCLPHAKVTTEMWTDASDDWYAWFSVDAASRVLASNQATVPEEEHIFYSELWSAIEGIISTHVILTRSGEGGAIRVHIDNAAAARCLERRMSTNFVANKWLSLLPDRELDIHWVPTSEQAADVYTRPEKGKQTPIAVPRPGSKWTPCWLK